MSRFHFIPGYLPVSVNLMDFFPTQVQKILNNFTFEIDHLTLRLPPQHAQLYKSHKQIKYKHVDVYTCS